MTDASAPRDGGPGEPGLEFLARVVAGQCHELTNVCNVMTELCGLQDDLLPRVKAGEPAALAKLGDFPRRLQAQLLRCLAILANVRRLAHDVDASGQAFDAREVVARAVFLAARAARLRQTSLVAKVPEEPVALESDPFCLQHAIHLGVELLLGGAAPDGRITVALEPDPAGVRVALEGADPVPRDAAAAACLAALGAVLQAAAGEVREMPHRAPARLVLWFPRRPAAPVEVTDAA
jgi:hypothetical protein